MKRIILLSLLLIPLTIVCQEKGTSTAEPEKKQTFGITFSGFVKSDFFIDSRQTIAPREGHFMLWPAPIKADANGLDINDGYNTNFLPIQSQLSGKITGPDVLGAKTSGVLEGDFFGTTNADINLLRMRHAFMKLNWAHAELLMGQYWHPMFNTQCFPATISFNSGAPVNPFSRDPQIRFGYTYKQIKLMLAAVEQRDYPSYGVLGASPSYLRNAVIPELYGEISFNLKHASKPQSLTAGLMFGTKTLVPRLESVVNNLSYKVDESVQSIAASGFINFKTKPLTIKMIAIYGENLADVMNITGFAVTGITDTLTGHQSYAPTASQIVWADIHTNGAKWQVGLFAGINQFLGSTEEIKLANPVMYGVTTDIMLLYRISPRVSYSVGKMRFAAEMEHTSADFAAKGSVRNNQGIADKTDRVANTRVLLAAYYFF
jgi:hypothetical protein